MPVNQKTFIFDDPKMSAAYKHIMTEMQRVCLLTETNANSTFSLDKSYSENEQNTGMRWIDGKSVYRKVVDFGALPNATIKNVSINVPDIDKVIRLDFMAENSISGSRLPLPWVNQIFLNRQIQVQILSNDTLQVFTSIDYSHYTTSYAIIEYTKL